MPDSAARSTLPVKAVATGPVISTWPSSRHSIVQFAAVDHHRRRAARSGRGGAALTSAAQAPEPQARVRPAPRSQTRRRMRSGASIWAKPILARSGNSGSCSSAGPSCADRQRGDVGDEERRVRIAHAGGGRVGHRPERQVEMQRVHRPRPAGCRASPAAAGPMSTLHPPVRQHVGRQIAGDGRGSPDARRPVSRSQQAATQRVALPQAPASPPSGLRMRMKASALEPAAAAR